MTDWEARMAAKAQARKDEYDETLVEAWPRAVEGDPDAVETVNRAIANRLRGLGLEPK